jgi:hypothetical protein
MIFIGDYSYTVGECDHFWVCYNINLQIEELVILLHVKEIGQEDGHWSQLRFGIGAQSIASNILLCHFVQSRSFRQREVIAKTLFRDDNGVHSMRSRTWDQSDWQIRFCIGIGHPSVNILNVDKRNPSDDNL